MFILEPSLRHMCDYVNHIVNKGKKQFKNMTVKNVYSRTFSAPHVCFCEPHKKNVYSIAFLAKHSVA